MATKKVAKKPDPDIQPPPLRRHLAGNAINGLYARYLDLPSLGKLLICIPHILLSQIPRAIGIAIQGNYHQYASTRTGIARYYLGAAIEGFGNLCGGLLSVAQITIDLAVMHHTGSHFLVSLFGLYTKTEASPSTKQAIVAIELYQDEAAAIKEPTKRTALTYSNTQAKPLVIATTGDRSNQTKLIDPPIILINQRQDAPPSYQDARSAYHLHRLALQSWERDDNKAASFPPPTVQKSRQQSNQVTTDSTDTNKKNKMHVASDKDNDDTRTRPRNKPDFLFPVNEKELAQLTFAEERDIPAEILGRTTGSGKSIQLALHIDPRYTKATVLTGNTLSGLKVAIYKYNVSSTDNCKIIPKFILAFTPTTSLTSFGLVKGDIATYLGLQSKIFRDAEQVVGAFAEKYGADNIELSGFSLGGALAQFAGVKHDVKFSAFNAVGLNQLQRNELGSRILSAKGNVYNSSNDPVSQKIEYLTVPSQIGKRYRLNVQSDSTTPTNFLKRNWKGHNANLRTALSALYPTLEVEIEQWIVAHFQTDHKQVVSVPENRIRQYGRLSRLCDGTNWGKGDQEAFSAYPHTGLKDEELKVHPSKLNHCLQTRFRIPDPADPLEKMPNYLEYLRPQDLPAAIQKNVDTDFWAATVFAGDRHPEVKMAAFRHSDGKFILALAIDGPVTNISNKNSLLAEAAKLVNAFIDHHGAVNCELCGQQLGGELAQRLGAKTDIKVTAFNSPTTTTLHSLEIAPEQELDIEIVAPESTTTIINTLAYQKTLMPNNPPMQKMHYIPFNFIPFSMNEPDVTKALRNYYTSINPTKNNP